MEVHHMSDTATATGQDQAQATGQEAQATTDQQQTTGTPSPADLAARAAAGQQPVEQAQQQTQQQPGTQDFTGWPQEAIDAFQRRDADARRYQKEAGDQRIGSKENARREALAEVLKVLDPDAPKGEAPTVESVTAQLQEQQARLAASQREAAVVAAAWQAQVDPAKLDFLQWKLGRAEGFGDLDPTAADFQGKIAAAVASQVAADPSLRSSGTIQATGVEQHGGASNSSAITPEAFAAMSLSERQNLFRTDKAAYDRLTGNAS